MPLTPYSIISTAVAGLAAAFLFAVPAIAEEPPTSNSAEATGESCIPLNAIRSTKVRSNSQIDFIMRGGDVYRNNLPNRCPGLKFEQSFSYRTSLGKLCSADIIRVLETGAGGPREGAACGLGRFVKQVDNSSASGN